MQHKDVLVTGGSGFIGSHLVKSLSKANAVQILDTTSPDSLPVGVSYHEGDIRNLRTVAALAKGKDVIFHLAAMVDVADSIADPLRAHAVNDTGTINVLEAARQHDCRVVMASSAAVYGEPTMTPIPETHPLEPTSPYGLQKLTGDHAARMYADLYDLPSVVLRYFNVYGPGQKHGHYAGVIETFLSQAQSDQELCIFGDGQQTRDFIHVKDVVRANERAATADITGKSFNIGTGNAVTIGELAAKIRTHCDSKSQIVYSDKRDGDIRHSRADTDRAVDELGFKATIDLNEGLKTLTDGVTAFANRGNV